MEHRKASLFDHLGSVSLLPLIILLALIGCSTHSTYEEAVGLIKQKQYDEAKEVLKTIPIGDSLASKVPIALLTCEIGNLYLQGRLDDAVILIDSVQEDGEQRVYFLNPSLNDTLYSHISSLCMLIVCQLGIPVIEEFLAAPITDSVFNYYASDNWLGQSLVGILETDEGAKYQAVDIDESEGEYWDPPFIRSVGFDKLWIPPEWTAEVAVVNNKLNKLRPQYEERWKKLEKKYEEAAELYQSELDNEQGNGSTANGWLRAKAIGLSYFVATWIGESNDGVISVTIRIGQPRVGSDRTRYPWYVKVVRNGRDYSSCSFSWVDMARETGMYLDVPSTERRNVDIISAEWTEDQTGGQVVFTGMPFNMNYSFSENVWWVQSGAWTVAMRKSN